MNNFIKNSRYETYLYSFEEINNYESKYKILKYKNKYNNGHMFIFSDIFIIPQCRYITHGSIRIVFTINQMNIFFELIVYINSNGSIMNFYNI